MRALCDRRRGLGADGVLRVVPGSHSRPADRREWFMDYRNADGSIAEMCGNGVRVFVRYLRRGRTGQAGGVRHRHQGGPPPRRRPRRRPGRRGHRRDGRGTRVRRIHRRPSTAASCPASRSTLATRTWCAPRRHRSRPGRLDLSTAPGHDPIVFPHGVNVEFTTTLGQDALRMRVHERGVGETRSCGTGTVAAVAAALHRAGRTTGRGRRARPRRHRRRRHRRGPRRPSPARPSSSPRANSATPGGPPSKSALARHGAREWLMWLPGPSKPLTWT